MFEQEEIHYDLSGPAGQQQYKDALRQRATAWAGNFEELGGGDGEPYEPGQGNDLWIDIVDRWDDEFGDYAVSDIDAAEQLGTPVCEEVILALVGRRLPA